MEKVSIESERRMEEVKYLGVKELAEVMNCSEKTAQKLMHRADFPMFRVGREMKVSTEALREWARTRRG